MLGQLMNMMPVVNDLLPDGGPLYRETNLDADLKEPYNAVTAIIFALIALYWIVRLKGNYQKYKFLAVSMAILVVGGIGGTLYHAFRVSHWFLLMDVLPIYGLAVASAIFLWFRLLKKTWHVVSVVSFFGASHVVIHSLTDMHHQTLTSLEYVNLGLMIMIPLVGVMMKTKFRRWQLVLGALTCFALALTFRVVDRYLDIWGIAEFEMGTHWLWHSFGAMASFIFSHYLYHLISLRNRALRMRVDF